MKPLTPSQTDAMRSLANYEGQRVEVLCSSYDTGLSPDFIARAVCRINASTLRGLELRGLIKDVEYMWRGARFTVSKANP